MFVFGDKACIYGVKGLGPVFLGFRFWCFRGFGVVEVGLLVATLHRSRHTISGSFRYMTFCEVGRVRHSSRTFVDAF